MAKCNRCGNCCNPICMSLNPNDVAHMDISHPDNAVNKMYIQKHWRFISFAEAKKIRPEIEFQMKDQWWVCDQFDSAKHICKDHPGRPPICRDFPWYGNAPNAGKIEGYKDCVYWADVNKREESVCGRLGN